ncbi:MAG TPA: glucohydrolase, partial [Anaerolineae bacterium]|nr:glucohydrolase [Anaerolineae bacterium]
AALRAAEMTRDKNRTPLHWSNAVNGGFSPANVEPWLPVNPNYAEGINAKDQQDNPISMLNYYKRLVRIRKQTPALIEGEYKPVHEKADDYVAFLRYTPAQTVLVVLNYSPNHHELKFSVPDKKTARILFSSAGRSKKDEPLSQLSLGAFEVLIAELA